MSAVGKFGQFGRVVDRCESFIERRLAIALLFSEQFTFEPTDEKPFVARDALGVCLAQQLAVGPHRLDFALVHADGASLAIELDGHEYHDGSKDRAERDRARDRELVAKGWVTARFTGREIVRDAMRCAQEAHRLIVAGVPSMVGAPERASPLRAEVARPNLPVWRDEYTDEIAAIALAQARAEASGDDAECERLARRALDVSRARFAKIACRGSV